MISKDRLSTSPDIWEGYILIQNRRYLTSKVNSLFLLRYRFAGTDSYDGINKNSPPKMMRSPI
jgi:hypothetical protein